MRHIVYGIKFGTCAHAGSTATSIYFLFQDRVLPEKLSSSSYLHLYPGSSRSRFSYLISPHLTTCHTIDPLILQRLYETVLPSTLHSCLLHPSLPLINISSLYRLASQTTSRCQQHRPKPPPLSTRPSSSSTSRSTSPPAPPPPPTPLGPSQSLTPPPPSPPSCPS